MPCFSQDPELHHLMVTAAKAAPRLIIFLQFSLFVTIRSSRACRLLNYSISCGRTLSLLHLRRLLNCLCPTVLHFQDTLGRVYLNTHTRVVKVSVWPEVHTLGFMGSSLSVMGEDVE